MNASAFDRFGILALDDGVCANDPALAGVVEAVHILKVPLERLDVLSVGTTYAPDSACDFAGARGSCAC